MASIFFQTFTSHKYYTKTIIQNGGNGYWDEMYNHTKHVYLSNNTHLDSSVNIYIVMLREV